MGVSKRCRADAAAVRSKPLRVVVASLYTAHRSVRSPQSFSRAAGQSLNVVQKCKREGCFARAFVQERPVFVRAVLSEPGFTGLGERLTGLLAPGLMHGPGSATGATQGDKKRVNFCNGCHAAIKRLATARSLAGIGFSMRHVMLIGRLPEWSTYSTGPRKV
jgi:hypothetical protein